MILPMDRSSGPPVDVTESEETLRRMDAHTGEP